MTTVEAHLVTDVGDGDRGIWAAQIAKGRRHGNRTVRVPVDLSAAILGIQIEDSMFGSSTITLRLFDEGWRLVDAGFFDANADGKLDPIDVNYPEGSRFWWRLTQVSISGVADAFIEMTFMERAAVHLMQHRGPVKASRAKKTRAEFLKSLADRVKAGGGIQFRSRDLKVRQEIEGDPPERKEPSRTDKDPGVNVDEDLKIQGGKATADQLVQVERALRVAEKEKAGERPTIAMLVAGIGESGFRLVVNSLGYGGVFQGQVETGGRYFKVDDTEEMAYYFLRGGKGFNGGGAIKLAKEHQDWSPGKIATTVETSGEPPSYYDQYQEEAVALLRAGGGVSSAPVTYRKQYNFEIGSLSDPRETYWDGMQRLAEEVKWPLFLDGQHLYFDPETTLIRQKVVKVIRRTDADVVRFSSNWDGRNVATEAIVDLICDPFEFRAGEVVKLVGFGPASTGSTAKLPGRWLIAGISRDRFSLTSQLSLKQPEKPGLEPASEEVERDDPVETAGADIESGMSPKELIDQVVLPLARECGVPITVAQNDAANGRHGPTNTGGRSDHQGPPAERWAADMSNGQSPTKEMDKLADALARMFELAPLNMNTTGAAGSTQDSKGTYRGFKCQLIYRSKLGGNHDNHVHFGVQKVGKTSPPPVPTTPKPPFGGYRP